jgi:hypothetical protein
MDAPQHSASPGGLRRPSADPTSEPTPDAPFPRAVAGWLQQLSRTVKTCRLYDPANPTVVNFRRDLAASLDACLREHGPIQLVFSPQGISLGEIPLYTARTREDNLAIPFFRDGIRALTITPGIAPREVDALVDALLQTTRREGDDADLVTLLWEAEPEHLALDCVAVDGDFESGAAEETGTGAAGPIAPWPKREAWGTPSTGARSAGTDGAGTEELGRSDDRITASDTPGLEATLVLLQTGVDAEVERLRLELDAERGVPLPRLALELVRSCLDTAPAGRECGELHRYVPRVLHETVAQGLWEDARAGLDLLPAREPSRDAVSAFLAELEQPGSLTSRQAWACLDHQSPEGHEAFFQFARSLGPDVVEWLMHGLAESQRQGFRRSLARTIAGLARDNPERLAPWLADARWYVVRNVVHILGMIGGEHVAGLLRACASHSEFRVRREVVTALARVPRPVSRPVLLEMLAQSDTRLFGTILHHLATAPDPELGRRLLAMIEETRFETRPEEEKRAILHALAAVGDDSLLPALQARILQTAWFGRGKDEHRFAAAMCVARLGSPAARRVLEEGATSRRQEVARACTQALAAFRPRGETK